MEVEKDDKKAKKNRHHDSREKKKKNSRSRSHKKDKKHRSRSKHRHHQKEEDRGKRKDRSRSRDKKKEDHGEKSKEKPEPRYGREDKWKKERDRERFRFDSPPKSDESDMSENPQKMDKLNRMKAAKELVTSKADRKLYLGNLPPNITSNQLMETLNSALKKMEINTDLEGDSIVSAWISPDGVGHYAFVEFRTAQQATNGLTLNGASLYGYQLKLGRPKQYIEYNKQLLSEFGTDTNIDTIIKKVNAMSGFTEMGIKVEERIVCPPSKIIVLKHIVTIEELAIDEEFNQIYDDVMEMAKRFGDVIKLTIPRPHEVIDLKQVQSRIKGLGLIFIKYKSVDQARYARREFVKLNFSERSVACSYFPEPKFEEEDYDIVDKVIIDF